MTWDEYYDKVYDWKTSTAVSRLSSLEDLGDVEEVIEIIEHIGFEDEKGANRLLKKAIASGMKFTGEQLIELVGVCSDEVIKSAIMHSADQFSETDLEDLHCSVDDELVAEVARKFNIAAPADIEDEYAEKFVKTTTPLKWKRFYDAYEGWSEEYAKSRLNAVTDFGHNEDEIIEVLDNLFYNNVEAGNAFIERVLKKGFKFSEKGLLSIADLCSKEIANKVYKTVKKPLSQNAIEELYDVVDDASRKFDMKLAKETADYTLKCLIEANKALEVVQKRKKLGYESLQNAQESLIFAKMAVENFRQELSEYGIRCDVKIDDGKLIVSTNLLVINLVSERKTRKEVGDRQKRVKTAIEQVKSIKNKL